MEEIIEKINSKDFKNIIVCTGAGISTNAGIPDYRSKDGIFMKFSQMFPGYTSSDIFTRSFIDSNPEALETEEYKNFIDIILEAQPTKCHEFCVWLENLGVLKRVYTQNIDRLHSKAGLSDDKIVECHGSIFKNDNEIINNVVLYGDSLPDRVEECVLKDFVYSETPVDLIIVMGTSLQVAPFCAIPNLVNKDCIRVLVTKTPEHVYYNPFNPKKNTENMNSGWSGCSKTTTFGTGFNKRKVSLASRWRKGNEGKWKHKQHIFSVDCDDFCKGIMNII